jgi:aldehyde:ferredoxin oxidoreductase
VAYTIAWAMECYEKGIINKSDTDGVDLRFGNDEIIIDLIKKIAYREGFGNLLAEGSQRASQIIGKGSDKYLLTVKGQELEGMPERNLYVAALGVATSEVGPDHTRWYPPYPPNPRIISKDLLNELGVDIDLSSALQTRLPDGKGKLLRWLVISRSVVESLPGCVFLLRDTLGLDLRIWKDLLIAATGVNFTYPEILKAGERILNIERAFIVREGYRRKDDIIPRRMLEEPVPRHHYRELDRKTFNHMLDEYYEENGWDKNTAIPTREKLEELGLNEVIKQFDRLGIWGV